MKAKRLALGMEVKRLGIRRMVSRKVICYLLRRNHGTWATEGVNVLPLQTAAEYGPLGSR